MWRRGGKPAAATTREQETNEGAGHAEYLYHFWCDNQKVADIKLEDILFCLRSSPATPLTVESALSFMEIERSRYNNGKNSTKASGHVFEIATRAMSELRKTSRNQSILIIGDDGEPKNGVAYSLLDFLLAPQMPNNHKSEAATTERSQPSLADKLRAATILLDSFTRTTELCMGFHTGPAKVADGGLVVTDLFFDDKGGHHAPVGAHVKQLSASYELFRSDKAAVVRAICCALYYGASPETGKALNLRKQDKLVDLTELKLPMEHEGVKLFPEILKAMDDLEITEEERSGIFSILAGLMLLGHVSVGGCRRYFHRDTSWRQEHLGDKRIAVDEEELLEKASANLGVDKDALNSLLQTHCATYKKQQKAKVGPPSAAKMRRRATGTVDLWESLERSELGLLENPLIADLFARLVSHVVSLINRSLHCGHKEAQLFAIPHVTVYKVPSWCEGSMTKALKQNYMNDRFLELFLVPAEPSEEDSPTKGFHSIRSGVSANVPHKFNQSVYESAKLRQVDDELLMIMDDTTALMKASDLDCLASLYPSYHGSKTTESSLANMNSYDCHPIIFEYALGDIMDDLHNSEKHFVIVVDPSNLKIEHPSSIVMSAREEEIKTRRMGAFLESLVKKDARAHAVIAKEARHVNHWLKFVSGDNSAIPCKAFALRFGRIMCAVFDRMNTAEIPRTGIFQLPHELVDIIVSYTSTEDKVALIQTSSFFQSSILGVLEAMVTDLSKICKTCDAKNIPEATFCATCETVLSNSPSVIRPFARNSQFYSSACGKFLAEGGKSKTLAPIIEGLKVVGDWVEFASHEVRNQLEALLTSSKMAPIPPHVAMVNRTWSGSRIIEQGLDVEAGQQVLVVETDWVHGLARCLVTDLSVDKPNYRMSGWLPTMLLTRK